LQTPYALQDLLRFGLRFQFKQFGETLEMIERHGKTQKTSPERQRRGMPAAGAPGLLMRYFKGE
jgi:hypothetical protein